MQVSNFKQSNMLWGVLLIIAGIVFFLQNLGIFAGFGSLLATGLFGLGGLAFVYLFLGNRGQMWWAAIPGFTLLGLAAVTFLDQFGPGFLHWVSGPLFLASIGIGFVMVYLANAEMWWAIIPAGVMTTLAVVAGIDEVMPGFEEGSIFFLGLGVTFALLALSPRHGTHLRWAFIPAAVLIGMGILIGTPFIAYAGSLWPLVLIGLGLLWVWRGMTRMHE